MHEPPCEPLKACQQTTENRLMTLEQKMSNIEKNSEDILTILNTWNEGRAVVKWLKISSKIAIWLAATYAAIQGIVHALRHWG